MNNTITVEVIEPQQPWHWNVAQFLYFWGTLYFKGWQVRVTVNGHSATTEPAPKGPNPLDVAYATLLARELAEGRHSKLLRQGYGSFELSPKILFDEIEEVDPNTIPTPPFAVTEADGTVRVIDRG